MIQGTSEVLTLHFLHDGKTHVLEILEDGETTLYEVCEQQGAPPMSPETIMMSVRIPPEMLAPVEQDILKKARKDTDMAGAFEVIGEMNCINGPGRPGTLIYSLLDDPAQAKKAYRDIITTYHRERMKVAC